MTHHNATIPKACLILNIKIGVALRKVLIDSWKIVGVLCLPCCHVLTSWRNNPSSQQISFHSPAVADCPELNPRLECKTIITTPCHLTPPNSISHAASD